jgi:hypothetical protein
MSPLLTSLLQALLLLSGLAFSLPTLLLLLQQHRKLLPLVLLLHCCLLLLRQLRNGLLQLLLLFLQGVQALPCHCDLQLSVAAFRRLSSCLLVCGILQCMGEEEKVAHNSSQWTSMRHTVTPVEQPAILKFTMLILKNSLCRLYSTPPHTRL